MDLFFTADCSTTAFGLFSIFLFQQTFESVTERTKLRRYQFVIQGYFPFYYVTKKKYVLSIQASPPFRYLARLISFLREKLFGLTIIIT